MKELLSRSTLLHDVTVKHKDFARDLDGSGHTSADKVKLREANLHVYATNVLHIVDRDEWRTAMLDAQFDYQSEAMLTCSPKWYGQSINHVGLLNVLSEAVAVLHTLDAVKKSIFYGKFEKLPAPLKAHTRADGYDRPMTSTAIDTVHAIIGIATEAGELLEILYGFVRGDMSFDEVHLNEEYGDIGWYRAVGLKALNRTPEDCDRINIAKLRARFPMKFTEFDANNRNLANERRILETKPGA